MNNAGNGLNGAPRARKINKIQKQLLLEELEKCPRLVTGEITNDWTYSQQTAKWDELGERISRYGPPKTGKDLRKVWQDMKSKAKQKAAELNRETIGTGGGDETPVNLVSPTKERIISISGGNALVQGHHLVQAFGVGGNQQPVGNAIAAAKRAANTAPEPSVSSSKTAREQIPDAVAGQSTYVFQPKPPAQKIPVEVDGSHSSNVIFTSKLPGPQKKLTFTEGKVSAILKTISAQKEIPAQSSSTHTKDPNTCTKSTPIPTVRGKTPLSSSRPTKSDTALAMHGEEVEIFKQIHGNLEISNTLKEKSLDSQERLAVATELLATSLNELVTFVLKK